MRRLTSGQAPASDPYPSARTCMELGGGRRHREPPGSSESSPEDLVDIVARNREELPCDNSQCGGTNGDPHQSK